MSSSNLEAVLQLLVFALFFGLLIGAGRAFARRWTQAIEVADGPEDEPYRVYTFAYDVEVLAQELRASLPRISPDSLNGWYQQDHALWLACIPRLEALIAEQDEAAWNAARERISAAAQGLRESGLIVSLLVDHSGSMKGARIAWAALLAAKLTPLLSDLAIRSEVLGFTTAGWRGGYARQAWIDGGKPPRPGRLCALLHVIHKAADEDSLSEEARNAMLDPALLRENVDGEAILWARSRLAARPERHKLLIVVSDGAPVDDSTLACNGPSYLFRHLQTVLGRFADEESIILGGLGFGHSVEAFYLHSRRIDGPDELPDAIGGVLESMLAVVASKISEEEAGCRRSRE